MAEGLRTKQRLPPHFGAFRAMRTAFELLKESIEKNVNTTGLSPSMFEEVVSEVNERARRCTAGGVLSPRSSLDGRRGVGSERDKQAFDAS